MTHYLFKQLSFARQNTLDELQSVTEQQSIDIPPHFRNNIKWHAGHIYVIHEKFAFQLANERSDERFVPLFNTGTSPAQWSQYVPTLDDIIVLLHEQTKRIEATLSSKMDASISPYTTSKGLHITTVEQLLSFALYHEAMHCNMIKAFKQLLTK